MQNDNLIRNISFIENIYSKKLNQEPKLHNNFSNLWKINAAQYCKKYSGTPQRNNISFKSNEHKWCAN